MLKYISSEDFSIKVSKKLKNCTYVEIYSSAIVFLSQYLNVFCKVDTDFSCQL